MSYARLGPDSDVYIYDHVRVGLLCQGCDFVAGEDLAAMLTHIQDHRARGDKVPDKVEARLLRELGAPQASSPATPHTSDPVPPKEGSEALESAIEAVKDVQATWGGTAHFALGEAIGLLESMRDLHPIPGGVRHDGDPLPLDPSIQSSFEAEPVQSAQSSSPAPRDLDDRELLEAIRQSSGMRIKQSDLPLIRAALELGSAAPE